MVLTLSWCLEAADQTRIGPVQEGCTAFPLLFTSFLVVILFLRRPMEDNVKNRLRELRGTQKRAFHARNLSQAPTEVVGVSSTTTRLLTEALVCTKGNKERNPYVFTLKERPATNRLSHPFLGAVAGFRLQFPHLLRRLITSSIILTRSSQPKTSQELSNGLDFSKSLLT